VVTVADRADFNYENIPVLTVSVAVSDGVNTSLPQEITVSLNDLVETGFESYPEPEVVVYPNPTTDRVTITGFETRQIRVFDEKGNLLLIRKINATQFTLDVSNYIHGVYTLELQGAKTVIRKRIVVI
jgi:hypothetical protein